MFINWALEALYIKVDPLFEESSNIRPTLTIGDETYPGQDTFLGLHHYIWWEDLDFDWEVGDSNPFTLSLPTVSQPDPGAQTSAGVALASALDSLTDPDGGEAAGEEGDGGLSGWMSWMGVVAAVVVASIGYMAYRLLR